MKKERIGILGGTFNPIHSGHVRAAELVRDQFGLDRVLLIPSAVPPHKRSPDIAAAAHRLRMVELAVAGRPGLEASDLEIKTRGTSYSINTLARLRRHYPGAWIFFILGIDAFLEIDTWRESERVLEQCLFIVTSRPGHSLAEAERVLGGRLAHRMRTLGLGEFPREEDFAPSRIFLAPIDALDISATEVRSRARGAEPLTELVPPSVEAYIRNHHLYRETMSTPKATSPHEPRPSKRSLPREVKTSVEAAQAKKGEDILVLDLRNIAAFTDYFIILNGRSARQNTAIAEHIEQALRAGRTRPLSIEGLDRGEWVLMDYGFFVVHIFSPEKRDYYALEKLWGDARKFAY